MKNKSTLYLGLLLVLLSLEGCSITELGNPYPEVEWVSDTVGAPGRHVVFTPVLKSHHDTVLGPTVGVDYGQLSFEDINQDGIKEVIIESSSFSFEAYLPEKRVLKYVSTTNTPKFEIMEYVTLVLPNDFVGEMRITEDKEEYDKPHANALENYGILEYEVGGDGLLKVEDIKPLTNIENISFVTENVIPILKNECPENKQHLSFVSDYKLDPFDKVYTYTISKCEAGGESTEPLEFTEAQLQEYYKVYDDPYVKHIRFIFNEYLSRKGEDFDEYGLYNIGSTALQGDLEKYEEYLDGKFVVLMLDDSPFGGAIMQIIFQDKPDKVFRVWVYPLADEIGYDLRSFKENEEFVEDGIKYTRERFKVMLEDKVHAM